jgi:Co/Zn/Cd efflux system component
MAPVGQMPYKLVIETFYEEARRKTVASCSDDKSCEITAMRERHGCVLWIVLAINALMFLVEGWAGLLAHSRSLLADALDMLGDALVYGFSLFVLARSARWQAGAALAKGGFMLAFGLGVLGICPGEHTFSNAASYARVSTMTI